MTSRTLRIDILGDRISARSEVYGTDIVVSGKYSDIMILSRADGDYKVYFYGRDVSATLEAVATVLIRPSPQEIYRKVKGPEVLSVVVDEDTGKSRIVETKIERAFAISLPGECRERAGTHRNRLRRVVGLGNPRSPLDDPGRIHQPVAPPASGPTLSESLHRPRGSILTSAHPFVKWVGGKRQLLPVLREMYPDGLGDTITKYAEPFVGGGALLFDIIGTFDGIEQAYVSDVNVGLVTTYKTIRDDVPELIELLDGLQSEYLATDSEGMRAMYYRKRDEYNGMIADAENDPVRLASLFVFLNRTGFNGLYRVNARGLSNVAWGKYANPTICDRENLLAASELLQKVRIENRDYRESRDFIDSKTFAYFDPPYRPVLNPSSPTIYTAKGFDDDDTVALSQFVRGLGSEGAYVAVSSSDPASIDPSDRFIDNLYPDGNILRVPARRAINCDGSKRGKVNEILITNY